MITETLKACPVIPADGFSVSAMKIVESEQSGTRMKLTQLFLFLLRTCIMVQNQGINSTLKSTFHMAI